MELFHNDKQNIIFLANLQLEIIPNIPKYFHNFIEDDKFWLLSCQLKLARTLASGREYNFIMFLKIMFVKLFDQYWCAYLEFLF